VDENDIQVAASNNGNYGGKLLVTAFFWGLFSSTVKVHMKRTDLKSKVNALNEISTGCPPRALHSKPPNHPD
jgi:hypothetical protein